MSATCKVVCGVHKQVTDVSDGHFYNMYDNVCGEKRWSCSSSATLFDTFTSDLVLGGFLFYSAFDEYVSEKKRQQH